MKDRTLLMIPGPVEFDPRVLQALGAPTTSHIAPAFIEAFGQVLGDMRAVWMSPQGQPLVVAGSGTLAMELAAANLIEPGDQALVLSTGVFGDRFEDLLARHGAHVTTLRATLGDTVDLNAVEHELARSQYKLLTVTHVDTSTAVRMPIRDIGVLAQKYGALSVVDGVCSLAGEEVRQDEWGLDVVLTASQKAIGVPPGLALLVASPRALHTFSARSTPVRSYYADWSKWLPVMQAYESGKPAYFGTPAVNLIGALHVSLRQMLDEGMEPRFVRHHRLAEAFRAGMQALGLGLVAGSAKANTLTACHLPSTIPLGPFLASVREAGVIVAGGLHPQIKDRSFRVGHMGAVTLNDILATVQAVETALRQHGHHTTPGAAVVAAVRSQEP